MMRTPNLSATFLLLFLAGTFMLGGCQKPMMETVFPSMFGEDAVFGQTQRERRENVYGHVYIDLPQSFKNIGTVDIMWAPPMKIKDLDTKQYLTTTFYEHAGIYYLTQWTQLNTDHAYFEALPDVNESRWNTLWQVEDYSVLSNTANYEFAQYFDFLEANGVMPEKAYDVRIYARRFSGRIIIRVLEFTPTDTGGNPPPPFKQLYPLLPYSTVVTP